MKRKLPPKKDLERAEQEAAKIVPSQQRPSLIMTERTLATPSGDSSWIEVTLSETTFHTTSPVEVTPERPSAGISTPCEATTVAPGSSPDATTVTGCFAIVRNAIRRSVINYTGYGRRPAAAVRPHRTPDVAEETTSARQMTLDTEGGRSELGSVRRKLFSPPPLSGQQEDASVEQQNLPIGKEAKKQAEMFEGQRPVCEPLSQVTDERAHSHTNVADQPPTQEASTVYHPAGDFIASSPLRELLRQPSQVPRQPDSIQDASRVQHTYRLVKRKRVASTTLSAPLQLSDKAQRPSTQPPGEVIIIEDDPEDTSQRTQTAGSCPQLNYGLRNIPNVAENLAERLASRRLAHSFPGAHRAEQTHKSQVVAGSHGVTVPAQVHGVVPLQKAQHWRYGVREITTPLPDTRSHTVRWYPGPSGPPPREPTGVKVMPKPAHPVPVLSRSQSSLHVRYSSDLDRIRMPPPPAHSYRGVTRKPIMPPRMYGPRQPIHPQQSSAPIFGVDRQFQFQWPHYARSRSEEQLRPSGTEQRARHFYQAGHSEGMGAMYHPSCPTLPEGQYSTQQTDLQLHSSRYVAVPQAQTSQTPGPRVVPYHRGERALYQTHKPGPDVHGQYLQQLAPVMRYRSEFAPTEPSSSGISGSGSSTNVTVEGEGEAAGDSGPTAAPQTNVPFVPTKTSSTSTSDFPTSTNLWLS